MTDKKTDNGSSTILIVILILLGLWIVLGFVAFIMSLVCFGRTGTTAQHIIGLLIAILFGPLYFIMHFAIPNYCKKI